MVEAENGYARCPTVFDVDLIITDASSPRRGALKTINCPSRIRNPLKESYSTIQGYLFSGMYGDILLPPIVTSASYEFTMEVNEI
jgi:hypothetical protein